MSLRILCVGHQWRGADDGSLFKAFSRAGHLISIVDDMMFIPDQVTSFLAKAVKKSARGLFIKDFNDQLLRQFHLFNPDLVCIYKGASVYPDTLKEIKNNGTPVICVYPDVSLFDHGPWIPKCIPFYDHIFTTKTFGIDDLRQKFNFTKASLILHSVDPDIHRILSVNDFTNSFTCDASFIGIYSPKKDTIMTAVINQLPEMNIKIWGNRWQKSASAKTISKWQKQGAMGDLYALAINSSKINIAILSEQVQGSSSGDQITARTFQIPGAGGFMIHERTPEFSELFKEGTEAEGFADSHELVGKIEYYLAHPDEREKVARAGYKCVMEHHTSDHRAKQIIDTLKQSKIL